MHSAQGPGRLRLIITLGALSAFAPLSLDLYLPAFPQMAAELGTDIGAIQLTLSSCLLGLGLGQLIYGPLSDRFGRRVPLLAGIAVYIVASLACALAPSVGVLVGLRFVQALGGCAGLVLARAIARDVFEGRALARGMTAMGMVSGLAPAIAPTLGGIVLHFGSWRWTFVLLALFGAGCFVAVLALPETLRVPASHGVRGAIASYAHVASRRSFLGPALVSGLAFMVLFAYVSSGPAVMMEEYGLSATAFGLAFGAIALCLLVFARFTLRLLDRFSARRLMPGLLAAQAGASLLALLAVLLGLPIGFLLVPLAVAVGSMSSINGLALSEALRPFPTMAGAAAALAGVLQMGLGAVVAAALAGLPWSAGLEMTGTMLLCSTLALLLAVRLARKST